MFNPMFELLSKSVWPKVIWLTPHAPGLLKTPYHVYLQPDKVQLFNKHVSVLMKNQGIPILNFFHLTKGVMSYDGTHYSKGVNDVKVNIFLNYFLENRTKFKCACDNDIDK